MKNKDFVALQKKWYKKLRDDGFKDIEYGGKPEFHTSAKSRREIISGDAESISNTFTQFTNFFLNYDFTKIQEEVKKTTKKKIPDNLCLELFKRYIDGTLVVDSTKELKITRSFYYIILNVCLKHCLKSNLIGYEARMYIRNMRFSIKGKSPVKQKDYCIKCGSEYSFLDVQAFYGHCSNCVVSTPVENSAVENIVVVRETGEILGIYENRRRNE